MTSFPTFYSLDAQALSGVSVSWPLMCAPTESGTKGTRDSNTLKKPCRVLVVDDEDGFRDSLIFKLKKVYGATVEEAKNGLMALNKIAEVREGESFDLILMDISMPPGPTGIDISKEMLRRGAGGQIVLMSAYSTLEHQEEAQALGIILLPKPIDKDVLKNIILSCGGNTIS